MAKSKLKPTLEESFAVGKLEGERQALHEIEEMLTGGMTLEVLQIYVKAKLRTLSVQRISNPFKQKD